MTINTPGAFGGAKAVQKKSMSDMKKAFVSKVSAVKTAIADKPADKPADKGKGKEKTCPKCGKPMSKCTCGKGKRKGPEDD